MPLLLMVLYSFPKMEDYEDVDEYIRVWSSVFSADLQTYDGEVYLVCTGVNAPDKKDYKIEGDHLVACQDAFDDGGEHVSHSEAAAPWIYYSIPNTQGRMVATITLTVTYRNTGATQTLSADIELEV